ncbi:hypothetical protein OXX59_001193 [Metschnikowia pulcherrima]
MAKNYNLDLPALPAMPQRDSHPISENQFTRRKLQGLLHIMTAELKARGTKTPHIFLPFRSRVDDTKLTLFLKRVFPNGVMVDTSNKAIVRSLLDDFDEFTLICGLKYLWCRLPNNEVIGWPVYLEFKRKEHDAGYPKDAFLTIMPKCLSSSSHASIVYDFLDLMISIASNSQYNHLNGRKIAKMASIWAFRSTPAASSAFYDATLPTEASFTEGLHAWKQTCNGLFHLLLSFLRAMLPDTEAKTLNLPKTLQSLLITNTYPPPDNGNSAKSAITIPCVNVRSTRRAKDPYELISKVRHSLSYEKKDSFLSIENFTILKNTFQKPSTAEIVSTLSEESRRVLARLTADPVPSEFGLYPGWAHHLQVADDPDIPLYSEVSITSVTLQDYSIWTWLSSLGSDQTANVKSLFGRSIVVEAGLRGFQKWMVLTETTISSEEYLAMFDKSKHDSVGVEHYSRSPQISPLPKTFSRSPAPPAKLDKQRSLPPPPPPPKDDSHNHAHHGSPLPDVSFSNDQFSFEDRDLKIYQYRKDSSEKSNHTGELAQTFSEKMHISSKKHMNRPRPPPLDSSYQDVPENRTKKLPSSELDFVDSGFATPNAPVHAINSDKSHRDAQHTYEEPYEIYKTPFDHERDNGSSEPFDNYQVPGDWNGKMRRHITDEINKGMYSHKQPTHEAPTEKQFHQLETVPLQEPRSGNLPMNSFAQSDVFAGESSSDCERIQHYVHDDVTTGREKPHHVIADYQPSAHIPSQDYERAGTRLPSMEHTHAPSLHAMGRIDSRGEEQYAELSPAEPMERSAEEKERRKKKKKKNAKKKELEAMMANIPDGPPPPLLPDGQPMVINSPEVSLPYNDGPYSDMHTQPSSLHYPEGFIEAEKVNSGQAQAEFFSPASQEYFDSTNGTFSAGFYLDQQVLRPKKTSQTVGLPHAHVPPSQLDSTEEQSSPYPINEPLKDDIKMMAEDHSQGPMSHLSEKDYSVAQQSVQREGPIAQLKDTSVRRPNGNNEAPIYRKPMQSPQGTHQVAAHAGNAASRGDKTYRTNMTSSQEDFNISSSRRAATAEKQVQPATTSPHSPKGQGMRLRDETNWQKAPRPSHEQTDNFQTNRQHGMMRSDANLSYENNQFPPPQQDRDSGTSHAVSAQAMHKTPTFPQGMPSHALPSHAMPTHAMPSHAMPAHSMPTHGMPAHEMPAHEMPAHTMPFHAIPTYSTPVHGRPGQPVPAQAMSQMYYAPPPQGYFPPPQQAYGYQHPSMMYQAPAGAFQPPPHQQRPMQPIKAKPLTSELAMMNMPPANAFKKNSKPNKANLRAALNQGTFGI